MQWLNKTLFISPVYFGLCTSERQFRAEKKRLKIKDDVSFLSCGANATVHFYHTSDRKCMAIVCIPVDKTRDILVTYALLVHEATHIWQEICDNIGEKHPSSEFEAYGIQSIALELMRAYRKRDCRAR